MSDADTDSGALASSPRLTPAEPLWRLAPTRSDDGRSLADFVMWIPGLAGRPAVCRERVATVIREVCESYGDRVAFADVNYAISVVWVSVAAEPGLGGQVAQAIRQRVPDARLVGGHLAAVSDLPAAATRRKRWWRRLSADVARRLTDR